jgi:hypothetical protein
MLTPLIHAALASLALGAFALFLGMRGRRIDREPRCPARGCKYALGGVISAKRALGDEPFPLTCPECGRSIAHERSLRIGTRRTIKPAIALGVAMLLGGLSIVGIEGHALWKNAQAVNTMPLWLLLHQAKSDTAANGHIHQTEIVRRAEAGLLTEQQAEILIERVLRWQTDKDTELLILANAFSALAEQGYASPSQIERFWKQIRLFDLLVPDRVESGGPLPIEVRLYFRGGRDHNAPLARDMHTNGADMHFVNNLEYLVDELRIGGVVVDLNTREQLLWAEIDRPATVLGVYDLVWRTPMPAWDKLQAPETAGGEVAIDITIRWQVMERFRKARQMTASVEQTLTESLTEAGLPTSGTITLSTTTQVVSELPPIAPSDNPIDRQWLEAQMGAATLSVRAQHTPGQGSFVNFPIGWNAGRPTSDTPLYGDLVIRKGDRTFPAYWNDTFVGGHLPPSAIHPNVAHEIARFAIDDQTGWELMFIPRPERAARKVDRPSPLGGEPIVVPLPVTVE